TVVAAPNLPPTVAISSPTNNSVFFQPASVTIQATASDSGGSVSQVQFFAGTNSVGTDTTGPSYSITTNLAVGSYALTARATDNLGARATSSVVNVTIKAPTPLLLSSPRFTVNGHFQFDYAADPGLTYVVRR